METIPFLLGLAVLLPLISFAAIFVFGNWMGKAGSFAGLVATGAIFGAFVLSVISLVIWLGANPLESEHGGGDHAEQVAAAGDHDTRGGSSRDDDSHDANRGDHDQRHAAEGDDSHAHASVPTAITGDWYTLGNFGRLKLTIGYYVDALTVAMFCMVSLIATCIHFYSMGYMHDELHSFTDPEVNLSDGSKFQRPGRYHRFFQYLSLFSFSMLGLVVSGNVAMTFVFWELVGICSYFLIGFYIERKSASTAANKAFIVNRIGDFGMIIGMMAIWSSLGTFAFGDIEGDGPGIFSQIRPEASQHAIVVPAGMSAVSLGAAEAVGDPAGDVQVDDPGNRRAEPGYWLLIVAGVGIFCGCVGKSAQFPLHVWLPDAMEGPTPVSALVHSATMVAAGVFLVARFFPAFTPEVLLVIATVGCVTLFIGATIAITATDIKRVLAYSTVSQLGYMMLALGVGGWLAGVMHLITHAFFKSLLFMCSGSVIHATHTNEMTEMGGLRKKMPWTAYTMLIGCLAIAGAGIPFLIGFSGYYSKDAILEQALLFGNKNGLAAQAFFLAAAGGAAITAFYMFRLWYMTFAGEPRDQHRYDHAHESPPVMYVPLVILATFAVCVAWTPSEAVFGSLLAAAILLTINWFAPRSPAHHGAPAGFWDRSRVVPLMICGIVLVLGLLGRTLDDVRLLSELLEQARPAGTLEVGTGQVTRLTWPDEHASHAAEIAVPATLVAFSTALAGILLATVFYCWKLLSAEEAKKQFAGVYQFLRQKWYFDELYDWLFVKPTLVVSRAIAGLDRGVIDGFLHALSNGVIRVANIWDRILDRGIVDGFFNKLADVTYDVGLSLRTVQTGRLRQYVLFIVVGTVAVFVLASFFWGYSFAR